MEVPAAHLDNRAEAAVEGAAARGFNDIHLSPEYRVAAQHTCRAPWKRHRAVLDWRDGARTALPETVAIAEPEAINPIERCAGVERAYQLPKRQLSFAANDCIDADRRIGPRLGREAGVVTAHDNKGGRPQCTDQRDQPPSSRSLKCHYRQSDNIRLLIPNKLLDGSPYG